MSFDIADKFSLEGELALITGGGSGIGLGIARCFAAASARVVLVGRNEGKLKAAVDEIGPQAQYEVCDITRLDAIPELVEQVRARAGRISVLVNNAGNHVKKTAQETTDAEFDTILQTHVRAAFALSREVGREMLETGWGSILFIASVATFMGIPQVVAYSTAKAAYGGMVRALAADWSPRGVRVNAIAPGWIETDMSRKALQGDPARSNRILTRTPMGKFGCVEDIGLAAVYLSSAAARFVTGVVLPVDGGAIIGF